MTTATATTKTGDTITVNGKSYSVEVVETEKETRYILTGKRGAKYLTMRNLRNPENMFLINGSRTRFGAPVEGWLTDADGALVQYR